MASFPKHPLKTQARASLLLLHLFRNSHFLHRSAPRADGCCSRSEHAKRTQQEEGPKQPRVGSCWRGERLVTRLGPPSRRWALARHILAGGRSGLRYAV